MVDHPYISPYSWLILAILLTGILYYFRGVIKTWKDFVEAVITLWVVGLAVAAVVVILLYYVNT